MIVNIFDTTFNKYFINNLNQLSEFVTHNRTNIYVKNDLQDIFKLDKLSLSPTINLYNNFAKSILNKKQVFALINLNSTQSVVPQILGLQHLDIDTFIIKHTSNISNKVKNTFETFPEYDNKIILNITNIYNPIKNKITDYNQFCTKVVRDVISRSYELLLDPKNTTRLNTSIISGLIEIYFSIVGYNISRVYNLTYNDQKVVNIILAKYFAQRCYPSIKSIVPLYRNNIRLGSIRDINAVEKRINEQINNKELTIYDTIKLIRELGPKHLENFNDEVFFRLGRTYHIDHIISLTALEYPPYWLYCILTAIGGENKANMYWSLQKTSLLKTAKNLVKSLNPKLFDTVFE